MAACLRISALASAILSLTPLTRADAPEILSHYEPADTASAYGMVSVVRFSTGTVTLPPKVLAHSPSGTMRQLRFSENVWVLGYQTSISDEGGQALTGNYICHTLFCDQRAVQRQDQRMRALYSDGFTRGFRLPDGYAVPFSQVDNVHFMPMFNNRTDHAQHVRMTIELLVIREKDLRKPLRPLYSTLRSVQIPHLYFVPPKRHQKDVTFDLPFAGRIHFIGTHIHPFAESISLFDVSRGQKVWLGRTRLERDSSEAMETYSSVEGYPVHPGDVFRLSSVYNNPTARNIDAMSAVFVYYSED
jgi:hypothetical protein